MAAGQGYSKSLNNLASLYYFGLGVTKNYEKAFELFSKSSEQAILFVEPKLTLCSE
jgi:TPR repeat protein